MDERRRRLLELGREMFATLPYDDVSIEAIAGQAGISRGLLYHYFPSKRDFYVAVVRMSSEQLLAATEPRSDLPLEESMRATLAAYLRYVRRHAGGYRDLLLGAAGRDPELTRIVDAHRRRVTEGFLAQLAPGTMSPLLVAAARGWVGFVESTTVAWLADPDAVPAWRLRELLLRAARDVIRSVGDVEALPEAPPPTADGAGAD